MPDVDPFDAPAHVFLFRGDPADRLDAEGSSPSSDRVTRLSRVIEASLAHLDAGPTDLAICGAAGGGELLFARAALDRGLSVEVRLDRPTAAFLADRIAPGGQEWVDLFHLVCGHRRTHTVEAGADATDPVDRALAWGSSRLRFLYLTGGDGTGNGEQLADRIAAAGGEVHPLDPDAEPEDPPGSFTG